jgi:hypothetical protein
MNRYQNNLWFCLGRLGCQPAWLKLAGLGIILVLYPATSLAQSTNEPYTFTTVAGSAGQSGSADGMGSDARFYGLNGIAVDQAGNIYVADAHNQTIRKVSPVGMVTTLAGLAGRSGSADGTGSAARFYNPQGVAVDSAGTVYVTDSSNNTIRKVTPAGAVTTLAGTAQSAGSADGAGSGAPFNDPIGVAVDDAGNLYVADANNATLRKVTAAGVVTTLAGLPGTLGSTDGTGSGARFNGPTGVAVDNVGNVYVADSYNETIRKVTPAGVVTTFAGVPGNPGSTDGTGSSATFDNPVGIALDNAGNVYVADTYYSAIRKVTAAGLVTTLATLPANFIAVDEFGYLYLADRNDNTIRKGWRTQSGEPSITLGPESQTAIVGSNVTFQVVAAGTLLSFQWLWNGSPMPGQTNASLVLTNVQATQAGAYTVTVSNAIASLMSPTVSLTVVQLIQTEAELRAALQNGGLVKWDKDGMIPLTLAIPITRDTVLDGAGHSVTIDGQHQVRVFLVSSNVHFTLLNVTVANGRADQGGGLYNDGGSIFLSNCVFTGNQAVGRLAVGDYIEALDARGGAVCSIGGSIAASNCLFASDAAIRGHLNAVASDPPVIPPPGTLALEARGGAITVQDGALNLVQCQLVGNTASGGYYDTAMLALGEFGPGYGGALFLTNSSAFVGGCRLERNLAQSPGPITDVVTTGADAQGGAIDHEGAGQLQLQACVFLANQAQGSNSGNDGYGGAGRGGAVSTYGNLVADQCRFSSNACIGGEGAKEKGGDALGGALFATNTATLNHCLFSANWAHAGSDAVVLSGNASGGAVYAQGSLQILNTTFVSNWVEGQMVRRAPGSPVPFPGYAAGGGLFSSAVCVVTNSTWFQNRITAQQVLDYSGVVKLEGAVAGAAIHQTDNPITLVNCTIASNSIVSVTNTGAAVELVTNAVAQLSACLLSGNTNVNLAGTIVDQGFNLSSDHSVRLTNATSHNDIDSKLGDFGDHGGPTPTLPIQPDSPAIDAVTAGACPDTDQRGVPRPIGAGCDIGAFEFVPDPILSFDAQGVFQVAEVLQPVRDYQIDVSTNLIDWTLFSTNRTDDLGSLKFIDNTVTNAPYRFYRVVPQ